MAKYKQVDYNQTKFIPINFNSQLSPGTFEYTLAYIIEKKLDLSIFDHRYNNDHTGATAYDPKILLKIILLAYSRGVTGSRQIELLCKENIIFMALSCDTQPHFTTIANFISQLPFEIETIFSDVVIICDKMGLIGKQMFAIDGCKLPCNASKEWSGTIIQMKKKKRKLQAALRRIIKKHRYEDLTGEILSNEIRVREEKQIKTINKKIEKYKQWLSNNKEKLGRRNTPIQSNITDNDSGKMKKNGQTIQGYSGISIGDEKHQVVVSASVIGGGDERPTVKPTVESVRTTFKDHDPFETAKFTADSGFCSEPNFKYLYENNVDAYITDLRFRKRDERFKKAERFYPKERARKKGKFTIEDFIIDPEKKTCICPAGKQMWLQSENAKAGGGAPSIRFRGWLSDCRPCSFRKACLQNENQKSARQVAWFKTNLATHQTFTKRMKEKIDSEEGQHEYSKRLGIIEPIFANITKTIGLNRFNLRGKKKVDAQWKLFNIIHNIGKIQRYGLLS